MKEPLPSQIVDRRDLIDLLKLCQTMKVDMRNDVTETFLLQCHHLKAQMILWLGMDYIPYVMYRFLHTINKRRFYIDGDITVVVRHVIYTNSELYVQAFLFRGEGLYLSDLLIKCNNVPGINLHTNIEAIEEGE